MQDEQVALDAFVQVHASKLPTSRPSDEPVAYLVQHDSSGVSLDTPLTAYSVEDITSNFNVQNATIRWLLQQMQTYDKYTSCVLGLIFSKHVILAHVVQRGGVRTVDSDTD